MSVRSGDINEMLAEYVNSRSIELRNEIVTHYIFLAKAVAARFAGRGVDFDDLFQVASLALINALERYDTSFGVTFVSYAAPSLAGQVRNYFRDRSRVVRVPRTLLESYARIRAASEELRGSLSREPSITEIATKLGISEDAVIDALEMQRTSAISIDSPMSDDDGAPTLAEAYGETDKGYEAIESRDMLRAAMNKLTDTEKKIVALRNLRGESQKDTAKQLGMSQMSVSRSERRIYNKLRQTLEEN